jgi:hypothetical protein
MDEANINSTVCQSQKCAVQKRPETIKAHIYFLICGITRIGKSNFYQDKVDKWLFGGAMVVMINAVVHKG